MSQKNQGEPRNGSDDKQEKKCMSCGAELTIPGGYAGSGLCGPCCTGDSSTLDEFGETW